MAEENGQEAGEGEQKIEEQGQNTEEKIQNGADLPEAKLNTEH